VGELAARGSGGEGRGLPGGCDMGLIPADGPADRGSRHFQVEQHGDGVGFLGRVRPSRTKPVTAIVRAAAARALARSGRTRHGSGRPADRGGGLAAVAVHGDVGDARLELVPGDQLDRNDDQRHQDADLGHGGGEFLDASAGVAEVEFLTEAKSGR